MASGKAEERKGLRITLCGEKMSLNAKDLMIDLRKEEEDEYRQWLDFLDQQYEWVSSLIEQGHIPLPQETRSCRSLPPTANT